MASSPDILATPVLTVAEALAAFYARQGLPIDGGRAASHWSIALGSVSITLPNFSWRKKALPTHDLHHVLTGYACTPSGEFEMAAWEFAAGRYPHPCATAFCLPLVGIGAVVRPRRTFAAFARGIASQSLYQIGLTPEVLGTSLDRLRKDTVPTSVPRLRPPDVLRYVTLVFVSIVWSAAPFAAAALWIGTR